MAFSRKQHGNFVCEMCNTKFRTGDEFHNHLKHLTCSSMHTLQQYLKQKDAVSYDHGTGSATNYICGKCGHKYSSGPLLELHLSSGNCVGKLPIAVGKYTCAFCQQVFNTSQDIRNHIYTKHPFPGASHMTYRNKKALSENYQNQVKSNNNDQSIDVDAYKIQRFSDESVNSSSLKHSLTELLDHTNSNGNHNSSALQTKADPKIVLDDCKTEILEEHNMSQNSTKKEVLSTQCKKAVSANENHLHLQPFCNENTNYESQHTGHLQDSSNKTQSNVNIENDCHNETDDDSSDSESELSDMDGFEEIELDENMEEIPVKSKKSTPISSKNITSNPVINQEKNSNVNWSKRKEKIKETIQTQRGSKKRKHLSSSSDSDCEDFDISCSSESDEYQPDSSFQNDDSDDGDNIDFLCNVCNKKFFKMSTLKAHLKTHRKGKRKLPPNKRHFDSVNNTSDNNTTSTSLKPPTPQEPSKSSRAHARNVKNTISDKKSQENNNVKTNTKKTKNNTSSNSPSTLNPSGTQENNVVKANVTKDKHKHSGYSPSTVNPSQISNMSDHATDKADKGFESSLESRNPKSGMEDQHQLQSEKKSIDPKTKNNIDRPFSDDSSEFICGLCNSQAKTSEELKLHILLMHMNVPAQFVCSLCKKEFSALESLQTHMKLHTNSLEEQFVCGLCSQIFKSSKLLQSHMSSHAKVVPITVQKNPEQQAAADPNSSVAPTRKVELQKQPKEIAVRLAHRNNVSATTRKRVELKTPLITFDQTVEKSMAATNGNKATVSKLLKYKPPLPFFK